MSPELFITILKENNPLAVPTYTQGGCFTFFKILHSKFPDAEAFYDGDHVLTKIEGKYYDITGVKTPKNHIRMTQEQQDDAETWSPNINKIISTMLDQTTIDKIAGILKVKPEDFKAKLTSTDEQTIEIPDGTYLSEDDLKTRDKNKYDEAKLAFEEMTVKKIKGDKAYDDFTGKTFEELFQHHDAKLKSTYDSSADDRVKTLETDLAKMKETHEKEKTTLTEKLQGLEKQTEQQIIDQKILDILPKETVIPQKSILTLFKSTHEVKLDENKNLVISKDGQVLKNPATAAPLAYSDVVNEYVAKEELIGKRIGRGGGNEGGDGVKAKTDDEFITKWEKENEKSISSQEGVDALIKFNAENTGT